MTAKRLEGLRTLAGFTLAVVALVVGLGLVAAGSRDGAFTAFAVGIVGLFTGLAGKGSIGVLAQGTGTKGALETLTTSKQPGEPPQAP